jgi:alpha-D-ribose 1-methylphosphonate 5-triphosphate synthase subunit PhnL
MQASESPTLSVHELSKRFRIHEIGVDVTSSFNVMPGSIVVLVGASGSGKSSVLKCVYRTYLPSNGSVLYRAADDRTIDLASADELEILRLRTEEIRFVSQFLRVLPRQTSAKIVASQLERVSEGEAQERARATMKRVGLPERLWDLPPNIFSGGERQLLNLAKALVVRPRLLLLDEPTASLDPNSTARVLEAIDELKGPDLAMLAVFHDRRIVEQVADQTVAMSGGILWDS